MKEKEDNDKEAPESWQIGGFEKLIVRIAPDGNPDLAGKIIEARIDPKLGVAQLKQYYYCNGWGGACRECGLCPLIGHVDRMDNTKIKISEEDLYAAYASFGEEGLRNILVQLKFPHNFSGPVYISLRAEEYVCARVSEGGVDVVGIDLVNNRWLDCRLEIDEYFFMTSDRHLEFWVTGLIKKQILIGLIRHARYIQNGE